MTKAQTKISYCTPNISSTLNFPAQTITPSSGVSVLTTGTGFAETVQMTWTLDASGEISDQFATIYWSESNLVGTFTCAGINNNGNIGTMSYAIFMFGCKQNSINVLYSVGGPGISTSSPRDDGVFYFDSQAGDSFLGVQFTLRANAGSKIIYNIRFDGISYGKTTNNLTLQNSDPV